MVAKYDMVIDRKNVNLSGKDTLIASYGLQRSGSWKSLTLQDIIADLMIGMATLRRR